jgi:hypothetical protein
MHARFIKYLNARIKWHSVGRYYRASDAFQGHVYGIDWSDRAVYMFNKYKSVLPGYLPRCRCLGQGKLIARDLNRPSASFDDEYHSDESKLKFEFVICTCIECYLKFARKHLPEPPFALRLHHSQPFVRQISILASRLDDYLNSPTTSPSWHWQHD